MPSVSDLRVKLFADSADAAAIERLAANPLIQGFTTNPTSMRKAGVRDYSAFAREVLSLVANRPISFEVLADTFDEMEEQAVEIASWGCNVFVKIPITTTRREFAGPLISRLVQQGVQVNVTAVLTIDQVSAVASCLRSDVASYVSVFAGRIADTGVDPTGIVSEAVAIVRPLSRTEIIWASPRELLNVFQADQCGCQVITVTADVLAKLTLVSKSLIEYSLETVQMFRDDAVAAGYTIATRPRVSV